MNEVLSVKQISELLEVSENKVRHMFKLGELKGYKLGNKWRTTKNVVIKLIENQ